MLRVLELFGGIGACSKALERLGIDYEIADYVEIDKYAVASFNAMHNTDFKPQDIKEWNKDIKVDLIMHGSPCQDISVAGLQKGADKDSGTRSSLMYETIRIVDKLKPKYVIWENVKNLIGKKHKHNHDIYIYMLDKMGYNSYYQVLNAKDYGIPQNRERVFTISIRKDIDKGYVFPSKQELKLKLKDILELQVDQKYYLSEEQQKKISAWKSYRNPIEEAKYLDDDYSPCLTAKGNTSNNASMLLIKNATKKGYLEATEGDGIDLTNPESKTRRGRVQKEMSQTLTTQNNLGVCIGTYQFSKSDKFMKGKDRFQEGKEISDTLQTSPKKAVVIKPTLLGGIGEKKSNGGTQYYQQNRIYDNECAVSVTTMSNHYYKNLGIRKLTPKECWRLMGFDDTDFDKASKVNSDTQLYKQAGNSIVVNCLEKILNNLLK